MASEPAPVPERKVALCASVLVEARRAIGDRRFGVLIGPLVARARAVLGEIDGRSKRNAIGIP